MTDAVEIRELDDEELENKLLEARKELFNLRFQAATGRLDNNARVSQVRRDIARLMTEHLIGDQWSAILPKISEYWSL